MEVIEAGPAPQTQLSRTRTGQTASAVDQWLDLLGSEAAAIFCLVFRVLRRTLLFCNCTCRLVRI